MQIFPPLNPLRVFEVAARLESFTAAAAELGVTQSAVSRQIATLEGSLSTQLFVRERHGVMLGWHDPDGQPPSFEVPALEMAGWTPFHRHRFSLRGHPQETSENSVDLGHLSVVHGYRRVETVRAARADGAYLNARYRMARPVGVGPLRALVGYEFEAHLHGLGYSFVEVSTELGMDFRLLVLSTPTEFWSTTSRFDPRHSTTSSSLSPDIRPSMPMTQPQMKPPAPSPGSRSTWEAVPGSASPGKGAVVEGNAKVDNGKRDATAPCRMHILEEDRQITHWKQHVA